MLGMNTTTSDRFGTEIDIVKYIQCEASKLSSVAMILLRKLKEEAKNKS